MHWKLAILLAAALAMSACGKKESTSSRDRDRDEADGREDRQAAAGNTNTGSVRVVQQGLDAMANGDLNALADTLIEEARDQLRKAGPLERGQMKAVGEQIRNGALTMKPVDSKEVGDCATVITRMTAQGKTQHKPDFLVRRRGQWVVLPVPGGERFMAAAEQQTFEELAKWAVKRCQELDAGGAVVDKGAGDANGGRDGGGKKLFSLPGLGGGGGRQDPDCPPGK